MSAAITTPPSNLTPKTEVPVTMGFLDRGREVWRGERHGRRAGALFHAVGSASDFPCLLSFFRTLGPAVPASPSPASSEPASPTRPHRPAPCAGSDAENLLRAGNQTPVGRGPRLHGGTSSGRNVVKLPRGRTADPKSGPRLQKRFHLTYGGRRNDNACANGSGSDPSVATPSSCQLLSVAMLMRSQQVVSILVVASRDPESWNCLRSQRFAASR